MMPGGMKGKNPKATSEPVPITAHLAKILRLAVAGRSLNDPMLDIVDHPEIEFRKIAALVGNVDPQATPYCLRHSSITRMLLENKPIRVVASHHDTSVEKIESNYAAFITRHTDAMVRSTLLDFTVPLNGKVVAIR
jgi:integrase